MDYHDIFKDYRDYLKAQMETYFGYEMKEKKWVKGQERYIESNFGNIDRSFKILDIACGDGVGLRKFKEMGFSNVIGVELSIPKVQMAKEYGYQVFHADMHYLDFLNSSGFDVIYSSHTLEHAYWPGVVVKEFRRILKIGGKLLVILPYPDRGPDAAHGGKHELGTNIKDGGENVMRFFIDKGFKLISKRFDDFREPEIWLELERI